jgi:hypothetical protein
MEPFDPDFADLEHYTSSEQHAIVSAAILKRELKEQLLRGMYSMSFLSDRFFGRATKAELKQLVADTIQELAQEEVLDVKAEVLGYMGSISAFKATLWDMLGMMTSPLDTKNKLETIKLIHTLDNDRLMFIDKIGLLPRTQQEEESEPDMRELDTVGVQFEQRLETGSQETPKRNGQASRALEA